MDKIANDYKLDWSVINTGESSNDFDFPVNCFKNMNPKISVEEPDEMLNEAQKIISYLSTDISSAFSKDPAAKSIPEVLTSYPGIKAVLLYRVAHFLSSLGLPIIPRYLSSIANNLTGIDIHPNAVIGEGFFIDHGNGVVIGETTEIGNNVTLYQGVTLGGVSLEKEKRHPTLGNNIIVGAGAKILGPVNIGDNVKIGANSVVTKDVPSNSVVVGVPGRRVHGCQGLKAEIRNMGHASLPDPIKDYIKNLEQRVNNLEKHLNK